LLRPRRDLLKCIDGFQVPLPKKPLAAYRQMAQKAGEVCLEYGALEYVEECNRVKGLVAMAAALGALLLRARLPSASQDAEEAANTGAASTPHH
jgi:hypothetical protein